MELAFQIAFARAHTPKALVGRDGTFIAVNESFSKLVEFTELELQRKKFQDITDPDDVTDDEHEAERVAQGKIESYEMIKSYITKTKKLVRIKLRVDGVRDASGEFICFVAQAIPIANNHSFESDSVALVDMRTVKALAFLSKNYKSILYILTGLAALGYFIKDLVALNTK